MIKQALLALLLFTVYHLNGQTKQQKEVIEFEKSRCQATIDKDIAKLEQMLSDDFIYTHSRGRTQGKEQLIGELKSGKSIYYKIDLSNTEVRIFDNTALTNGDVYFEGKGMSGNYSFFGRYSATYIKMKSGWQLINWQTSRIENKLIIVATLTAYEGKQDALFKTLMENRALTLKNEPGCLVYEINRDLNDDKTFVLYEVWVNKESFELHFRMPYMTDWGKVRNQYVEIRDIKKLKQQ